MNDLRLQSEQIELRLIQWSDLDSIHALHSRPEVDEYNTLGIPADLEQTRNIIKPWIEAHAADQIQNYTFAIFSKTGNQFTGLIALKLSVEKFSKAEVWYKILPKFWGQGIGTQALNLILDFAFDDLYLHRVEAGCAVENGASIRLLEKVGMTREGRCREILPLKTGWSDNFMYAILQSDPRKK